MSGHIQQRIVVSNATFPWTISLFKKSKDMDSFLAEILMIRESCHLIWLDESISVNNLWRIFPDMEIALENRELLRSFISNNFQQKVMTKFMKAQKTLLLPILGQTRIFLENLSLSFISISRLLSLSKISEKNTKEQIPRKTGYIHRNRRMDPCTSMNS